MVAAGLLALVDLGQPGSAAEAVRSLELIREVWGARTKAPFVTELRETLFGLAEQSLAKRFEEEGPGLALHGEVKQLPKDRIQVTYDFQKPEQLSDWIPTEDRARPRGTFGELKRAEPLAECRGGVLETAGEVSLKHLLEFEGAQSLSWKSKMVAGEGVSEDQLLNFHVSLCHSGKTGSITVVNLLALEVADFAARDNRRQDPETVEVRYDTLYLCALEHDGEKRVRFLREGNEIFADDCGGCQSGGVQLWAHSDYVVEFDDVEITGKVTEQSLAALGERWIEAEVEALGLAKE